MKKSLFILLSPLLFMSCGKPSAADGAGCTYTESTVVAPADEIAEVQSYLDANNIHAIMDPSGVFYDISSQGSGATPSVCSSVSVVYRARLTDGTSFDSNTTGVRFLLGSLIVGWQKGLAHLQNGGSIKLIVPPSLGYGNAVSGLGTTHEIPANSILIFDIQLLNVQ